MPSTETIASLAGLALLCTSFAYILYFELLKRAGAMNLLLVTLLVPVSAILLGVLFLNESLSAMHLVGMALIATGLLAIDGRLFRRFGRAATTPSSSSRS
jgi:drug/metabolite transporter (DMT)-like permease